MIEQSELDGVRTLRLAHGKASALDLELVVALRDALARASADRVAAVVLTGTAHIFCAGVDLKRIMDGGADYVRRYLPAFRELMFTLFSFPRPLVVAANGHAIAGGAVLVAAGDLRLMAAGSGRFGYTELLVGVPFPPAAMEIIRFGTPATQVGEMLYTAATFMPDETLTRGCVQAVLAPEQLLQSAVDRARQMGAIAPAAFEETKRHLRADALARMHEREAAFGAAVEALWCAEETHRRIRGYLERTLKRA